LSSAEINLLSKDAALLVNRDRAFPPGLSAASSAFELDVLL
jgi:hypothetical protein